MSVLAARRSLRRYIVQSTTYFSISIFLGLGAQASPIVKVVSPKPGETSDSPVAFSAIASSSSCAKGISAIRIYTAPNVSAYTVNGDKLETSLTLAPGTYGTVIQAWDNCGEVGKTAVNITVTGDSASNHFLYVMEGNGVSGWKIDASTGVVSATGQAVVAAHVNPYRAASDANGTHLYVANSGSNDVSAYTINRANGYLSPSPGSPYAVGRTATAVAVHPSGKFVYVTRDNDAAGDGVAAFSVSANGSLAVVPGSPFSTQINPASLVVDSTGKYLYVADSSYAGYIDAFSINDVNGALTPLPGSPYQLTSPNGCSGSFPSDIVQDVAGSHLYTADSFDNAISGYAIASSAGTLTQVPGSAFPDYACTDPMVAFNPDTITVLPSGKFLYASNGGTSTISIYSLQNGTGALGFVKETPKCFNGTSSGPIMRSDPSGKFIYSIGVSGKNCTGGKAIIAFATDPTTGNLTAIKGSPFVDSSPTGSVSGAIVVVP
jgi:6-phosphogluconolactonase (cycloisomerase 2 family)